MSPTGSNAVFEPAPISKNPRRRHAIVSDTAIGAPVRLGTIWSALLEGTLKVRDSFSHDERCFLVLERTRGSDSLPPPLSKRSTLELVLQAGRLKVPALELGRTSSTVLLHSRAVLDFMGVACGPSKTPALLILSAYAAHGLPVDHDARISEIRDDSRTFAVVSATRPDVVAAPLLSPALRDILRFVVDGLSHNEIARIRRTSVRTVSNQLSSIFHKLDASGRLEVVRKLVMLGGEGRGVRISA